jgi:hypothetical protein
MAIKEQSFGATRYVKRKICAKLLFTHLAHKMERAMFSKNWGNHSITK